MSSLQFTGQEQFLRRYDYDDSWVIAADLGVDDEDVSVDIIGDTAIIVIETDDDVAETEFELPSEGASVTMNNGILTIEG